MYASGQLWDHQKVSTNKWENLTKIMEWDSFWGDQTMQMNGHFEGLPLIFVHCLGWCHMMTPVFEL